MYPMSSSNLFADLPDELPTELFQTIVHAQQIKIERIVSKGHQSAAGYWYDQEQAEWVLMMQGRAQLEFEDCVVELTAGDYINIGAHVKHRVKWTTPDEITIWLAIFY